MFEHWSLIDVDLHEFFGIDTGTGILKRRSRSWLQRRIEGLLHRPSSLRDAVWPDQKGPGL